MLKRTLFFGSPGKLSVKNTLLCYTSWDKDENQTTRTFPLEDLGCVVVESMQMTLTSYCISVLAENNIMLLFCDSSHMPAAETLPFSGNSLTGKHTAAQLDSTPALKGRLWKQTVQAKIINQAGCLTSLGIEDKKLRIIAGTTRSGDHENCEAVAARHYFKLLGMNDPFLREREGEPPNNALNYGYAILRAACARALTGSGLLCCVGIHHSNQYNAFALADDIMEPYRPFVDEMVFSEREFFSVPELRREHKARLLQILVRDVQLKGERRPLSNVLSFTSASLVRCFLREENILVFPEFP
jgi:CRISPR-associated protein Cas1